jgi:peptide/nickel transport system substrate-binding protein
MAKSAYPNGFTASTDTINYGPYTPIDEVIAAELQKIGISLKVNVIDVGKWVDEVYGTTKPQVMFLTIASQSPDPALTPNYMLGSKAAKAGGLNVADWTPPDIDHLLTAGVKTINPAKRLAIYTQMVKRVATDIPYVPLYLADFTVALSNGFTWPSYSSFPHDPAFKAWALEIRAK